MSYCRFSSMNSRCDVYVYLHVGGKWVTHVAQNKADMGKIGLPYDGATFEDDTANECADRLTDLRNLGYTVPKYAINELRKEAKATGE